MKVNYERVIEVNNELKVNVEEQQDDLKHLKEHVINHFQQKKLLPKHIQIEHNELL